MFCCLIFLAFSQHLIIKLISECIVCHKSSAEFGTIVETIVSLSSTTLTLTYLAIDLKHILIIFFCEQNWGGRENGFGLAECCQDLPMSAFPSSATTLHFEYFSDESANKKPNQLNVIHVDNIDQIDKSLALIMEEMIETYKVPNDKQMLLFTHLRLAKSFSNYKKRLQCVQARLQALSIIVYCQAMSLQENATSLLYNGLIEELVDVLELNDNKLIDIKAASLRTLTSIIHLDRNSKLNVIIDVTGAASYHGFLPVLVRSCIQALIDGNTELFPLPFATALFSFLYHLASYENGGEALVQCGMMESLLKVINWKGTESEHITV